MTELEWLKNTEPYKLLSHVGLRRKVRPTPRKLRLCGCECVNLIMDHLEDERSIQAVRIAEQFADGKVSLRELRAAGRQAKAAADEAQRQESRPPVTTFRRTFAASAAHRLTHVPQTDEVYKCRRMVSDVLYSISRAAPHDPIHSEMQSKIIKDIFGSPSRVNTINSAWLTSTVLALAQGIYDEKAFDRMPILADALQDAGCDSEEILKHCRDSAEHWRGCWVVDLVLEKL